MLEKANPTHVCVYFVHGCAHWWFIYITAKVFLNERYTVLWRNHKLFPIQFLVLWGGGHLFSNWPGWPGIALLAHPKSATDTFHFDRFKFCTGANPCYSLVTFNTFDTFNCIVLIVIPTLEKQLGFSKIQADLTNLSILPKLPIFAYLA